MRGLILCIAIGCLAFASGAPTDEQSKVQTKEFKFDTKEGILARKPFSNDELVYAVCEESSTEDKKCKVYVEAPEHEVQSCDVSLKYKQRSDFEIVLYNAGNSRAVFAEADGPTKVKLINVNLKGCKISEASFDVPQHLTREAEQPLAVIILPHESNYDVFYKNSQICGEFLCKATYDYEGKVVKAVAKSPIKHVDFGFYEIESAKNGYLVSEVSSETNVYLVHDGDEKAHTLFSGARGVAGLSTEENEISYCAFAEKKLECKQFDAEGKAKKIEIEIPTGDGHMDALDVYNLEKGLLSLSVGHNAGSTDRNIFLVHFDEQGKQAKSVSLDLKCKKEKALLAKLYKNSNGQYCVSSICVEPLDSEKKIADFSRSNRCFQKTELF